MPEQTESIATENTRTDHNGTRHIPRANTEDIPVVTRDHYDDASDVVAALAHQETRDPLDDSNCCDGGDHGFRVYKTDLPVIQSNDIEPGVLVYRPTTNPLTVYELTSTPYQNEYGSHQVDATAYSRRNSGTWTAIDVRDTSLFHAMVVDEMTFLQPETVQDTLPGTTPEAPVVQ